MLVVWTAPSVPQWCSGGLPNPGFWLPNPGVGAVHVALVGNRLQHQGVAVKLVAKVLVMLTLTGFLAVWLAKIVVARFSISC